jgi:hypothetical protein
VLLLPSAARAVSGTQALKADFTEIQTGIFQLTVSAAAAAAGDTLNVYIQHSVDAGATWDDFVSYTQVLGNGGTKKFLAYWSRTAARTTLMAAPSDGALAAGVAQGPIGPMMQIKWVIAGSTPNFTFKIDGQVDKPR